MKYAIKSKRKTVAAYCLGAGSAMETALIQLGRIVELGNGQYELFSQEATNGKGQIASSGDYFKVDLVDGQYYPYPNKRTYFLANHDHLEGDTYIQRIFPLAIWQVGDEITDAVQFLLDSGQLRLDPEHPQRYFNAFLWGADLSAAENATLVFYDITRTADGTVTGATFNFVACEEFRSSYVLCEPPRN